MNKFVTENLILLEFLVDEIYFTEATKKKIRCIEGETNVMFQFLDNKPIVITGAELESARTNPGKTKTGKSCLFSMSAEQGIEALGRFIINLKVYQRLPAGILPNVIDIACGEVCISELFQELMESAIKNADTAWVKCQKEIVKLYCCTECVGSISCFIRMSCYGKYIIAHCELNMGEFSETAQSAKMCENERRKSKCLPFPDGNPLQIEIQPQAEWPTVPPCSTRCSLINIQAVQSPYDVNPEFVSPISARNTAFKMLDAPAEPSPPYNDIFAEDQLKKIFKHKIEQQYLPQPEYQYSILNTDDPLGSEYPYCSCYDQNCCLPSEIQPCAPCPGVIDVPVPEKELIPSPRRMTPAVTKLSKDELILRLAMPNYCPDKTEPQKPYEFKFITPSGWSRETYGKQCRETQCDCRDLPDDYLTNFYGADKLKTLLAAQKQEEDRINKIYGPTFPLQNETCGKKSVKSGKKSSKKSKGRKK